MVFVHVNIISSLALFGIHLSIRPVKIMVLELSVFIFAKKKILHTEPLIGM